jgi:protein-disulfide isomerase
MQKWLAATCLALAALWLVTAGPAAAQSAVEVEALKSEIQALRQGQAAIQKELTEIKRLLRQRPRARTARRDPPFEPTDLSVAGAPALGAAMAPVTLVEFTDYQCPYCRRYNLQTKPQLIKDYVEAGKLRYVLREFPIESIHPRAFKVAEAALCAGDQDRYWDMNALFFRNQKRLRPEDLVRHAETLELDMTGFRDCLDGGKYTQRVRDDLRDGAAAGVRGTPSFFLGLTDPDDPSKIKATKFLRGAQPYPVFKQAIDALIAQAAKGS